ncbi:MAG: hypothetical protein M1833_002485 [Piccolia ochrophora]|nr:MAG: hypothetical protein M1833_002485 [Piccolia ochrophora]
MPHAASWVGSPSIRGSSESLRMGLLTFSMVGLQFTWGIELTYCTPYLLELGLTKSRTALVWIAGPLSGLIMQPVVGILSDRSKSKWGRRRPYMMAGSVIVALCLLVLGWAAEIVSLLVSDEATRKSATIALAVLSLYAIDFAINAVQSTCRSLIVDTLPIPKQQLGAAWEANRMAGFGHVVGYILGALNLVKIFGTTMGDTQFKQLCVVSGAALLLAQGITSYCVTERVLVSSRDAETNVGATKIVSQILKTVFHLPRRVQAICWTQFWAWIGWFPFLFYGSTWVGETYLRYSAPEGLKQASDATGLIGRVGSQSLLIFSIVSFAASMLLPWLIKSPEDEKPGAKSRPPRGLPPLLRKAWRHKPDLLTAWMAAHFVFSFAMLMAPFVQSVAFATLLVALCGFSWALAGWAPYSFIGVEINRMDASSTTPSYRRLSTDSAPDALHIDDTGTLPSPSSSTGELAGIYLGILNLFTTMPQFVGNFISGVVFTILEPRKSSELSGDDDGGITQGNEEGVNAISVCLFIGALCTLGAAYSTRGLRAALQQAD